MKRLLFITALFFLFSSYSQQNDWDKRAPFLGGKRTQAIGFSIGDFGYLGSGVDTAEMTHNDLWKFDPALNLWTQVASMPASTRRCASAITIDDKAYVGLGADSASSWAGTILNDWWQYDAVGNSWTQKTAYPGGYNYINTYYGPGVYYATAFSLNGKGYVCGGKMGGDLYAADLWEYDPILDTWTRMADFPGLDRYQLSSFALEGKGYVGMGVDHDLYNKDWWQYDPNTDTWVEVSSLPGVERGSASTFVIGQRGFVVFGSDGGYKDELWEYNPFTDSWQIRANFPGDGRKNGVAFTVGDSAYAGTGKGASGKRRSFYRYYPLLPVGVEETFVDFKLFPNPTADFVTISGLTDVNIQLEIVDLKGVLVFKSNAKTIDLSTVESGSYIVNIFNQDHQHLITKKLIVNK
ncbi:T9SS type A sorting domain-containing protein [Paracrocinitomix mangrovi]|uniref:kelch repeat-containing protein n=1 Tax=Paracrocinitomix mangrovi TaxID=2862509 RepID=UPI001C8F1C39|nr:kelch repeat-containing protein [Paracrocinitomix mangrovi]UKN02434.1 T9SS type A sorting domain-containing protein [Paracrocinitomix mangrovi]